MLSEHGIPIHIPSTMPNSLKLDPNYPPKPIKSIDKQVLVHLIKFVSHEIEILN